MERRATCVLLSLILHLTTSGSIPIGNDPLVDVYSTKQNISISRALFHRKVTTSAPQSYLRSLCEQPRGRFRHPLDCHKYLDCWDGRVLEKYCPDGTVFSDLPGAFCDFAEYVDCGERSTTLKPQPTSTSSRPSCNHFQRPKPVSYFPEYELFDADSDTNQLESSPFIPPPVPGLVKFVTEKFYLFVRHREVNFTMARKICQRMRLDLATISSLQENLAITNQIRIIELDSPSQINNSGRYWIGAMHSTKGTGYVWTATDKEVTFTDWLDGQPDDGKCVHFLQAEELGWTTSECNTEMRFICQWYPPKLEKRTKISRKKNTNSDRSYTMLPADSSKKIQVIRRRVLRRKSETPTRKS